MIVVVVLSVLILRPKIRMSFLMFYILIVNRVSQPVIYAIFWYLDNNMRNKRTPRSGHILRSHNSYVTVWHLVMCVYVTWV